MVDEKISNGSDAHVFQKTLVNKETWYGSPTDM